MSLVSILRFPSSVLFFLNAYVYYTCIHLNCGFVLEQ
uniref:Uncharacterized protein n=1 Tax=Rhizophora mucronata TaxID=61149 RepID=A0A2P2PI21_RHIMU